MEIVFTITWNTQTANTKHLGAIEGLQIETFAP
jgi:hypothetical protein